MGGLDDVGLNHQVFVDELRRIGVVGVDAAHLGRCEVNLRWLFVLEKGVDRSLIGEIELGVGTGDDVVVTAGLELPHDGRTHHPPVPCNVDLCMFGHIVDYVVIITFELAKSGI